MKHQVCASLLLVSFSLCADFEAQSIADKSKRVGRFSYEDSFDENLVETVLEKSSAAVKRNVKRLLYPAAGQEMQRLLLLGGVSNASTTAIAKSIATRCGYEYYVVEASALLQEYREGRQMLLSEIRPIIKQGKPIAIIITELPEMADYSGLLASTLWLLIDQCAQYPDVFVIGTSAFQKGQLSEEIKDRFGGDIVSVALDKSMQDSIENAAAPKPSWLERNKVACFVAGGLVGLALAAAHLYAQVLFAAEYSEREKEKMLLDGKMIAACEAMLLVQKEGLNMQGQQHDMQKKQYHKQGEQYDKQGKQYDEQAKQYKMQKEQYRTQLNQYVLLHMHNDREMKLYRLQEKAYSDHFARLSEEDKKVIIVVEKHNEAIDKAMRKKCEDFYLTYGN